jgi:hypothetical protein
MRLTPWKFLQALLSLWAAPAAMFIFLAPPAAADEYAPPKPAVKKSFFRDRPVLALWAADAAMNAADVHETRFGVTHGWSEGNPLARPFVHSRAFYAEGQAEMFLVAALAHRMRADQSHSWIGRVARHTWWIPQTYFFEEHARGAATWWGTRPRRRP